MKFSIITPAFNESERIEQCIKSVLNQSFKDFEMIVVDDGSHDDTAEKVEFFTKTDNRIKLIIMGKNSALTAAKNAALEIVKGEYLVFVDADDWILPEMLSDLSDQLNNFDNIDMFRLIGTKVTSRSESPKPSSNYKSLLCTPMDLIRKRQMSGYMHNLIVKNELVQHYNIRFRPGQVMLEDQEFTMKCMVYSKDVLFFTKRNYIYYQHLGSLSKNEKTDQLPDILNCALNVYEHAQNHLSKNELQYYKDYALMKYNQFLRSVYNDKNFTAYDMQVNIDKFFNNVDLTFWNRMLIFIKYKAIKFVKVTGI